MAKYLTRTPSSTGNQKTWTFSAWIKRGRIGAGQCFMGSNQDSPFQFDSNDQLLLVIPASTQTYKTNRVYRDPAAWYHIVIACDTTQATASNRLKVYTNGVLETSLAISTYPNQNIDTGYNSSSYKMFLGANRDADILAFDGFMSDFYWVDGQALAASVFGQTDATSGQWVPKGAPAVRTGVGSFGTNGCYLPFSTKTSTTTLGYDYKAADRSGTLCDWTLNNTTISDAITEGYDANFATLSDIYPKGGTNTSINQGGLQWNFSNNSGLSGAVSTMALPSSGKWFFEFRGTAMSGSQWWGGVANPVTRPQNDGYPGNKTGDYTYGNYAGEKSNSNTQSSYGASWTTNDVIGVLADVDAGTVTFYKNGSSQGVAYTGLSLSGYYFIIGSGATSATMEANFGQGTFVSGSGYSDANGRGKFQYAVPSGALALCEKNITNSTVPKGGSHFQVVTWSGNSTGARAITGVGFRPDVVLLKQRNGTYNQQLHDAVRGATNGAYYTNTTDIVDTNYPITSFDADGFTLGNSASLIGDTFGSQNRSGNSYVAWCWKAGNGTATNNDGSVQSTVSVNQTAGFSIVKYNTGSNSGAYTVGHGLNSVPKFIIVKGGYDSTTYNSDVYHVGIGNTKRLIFNSTSTPETQQGPWNNTTPTSTVISQNNMSNVWYGANKNNIAYVWSEIAGYSKFGTYTGNSSYPIFVYTGFKPRFIMLKSLDNTYPWQFLDTSRSSSGGYNPVDYKLSQSSAAENDVGTIGDTSQNTIDFLSNGFRLLTNYGNTNLSGNTYVYCAWAENPFDTANAR